MNDWFILLLTFLKYIWLDVVLLKYQWKPGLYTVLVVYFNWTPPVL